MNKEKSPMWQFPWRYKESIAFVMGILIVGIMLQLILGNFNFYFLHAPTNIIAGLLIVAIVVGLSFIKNSPFVNWLSGVPLSVTLIAALMSLALIMGLVPQFAKVNTNPHIHLEHSGIGELLDYACMKLGFKQITTSWPFVLIYTFNLLVLGLVVSKRLHKFTKKDYAFYLNHAGLWLFLFAAGLGSADMLRYVIYVEEGNVEWRVYDSQQNLLELDIAIQLHDFSMEEYPPKLAIIDNETGDVQPLGNPQYIQLADESKSSQILDWQIDIEEYIHEAVRKTDTTFQAIPMTGSMPAVSVTCTQLSTGKKVSGWITCGSVSQYFMPLELDENHTLVMTKPEPKKFISDVTIMTKGDNLNPIRTTLEVNKPFTLGSWMIYQYDYDHELGKASRVSGFELVYDPWLKIVYIGIIFMALGAICMLWLGNKKKGNYDLE